MKKKIITFLVVIGVSATIFVGCGDDKKDTNETTTETTTETSKKEEQSTHPGAGAVESIKDAVDDYLSGEEADIYKEYLEQSLEGQLSDEMINELQDIIDGSVEND